MYVKYAITGVESQVLFSLCVHVRLLHLDQYSVSFAPDDSLLALTPQVREELNLQRKHRVEADSHVVVQDREHDKSYPDDVSQSPSVLRFIGHRRYSGCRGRERRVASHSSGWHSLLCCHAGQLPRLKRGRWTHRGSIERRHRAGQVGRHGGVPGT